MADIALNRTGSTPTVAHRQIAVWLLVVAGLVFAMVVLGGATRLTNSGLSMVEWEPIMGWIPPLSEADWQAKFEAYKQFPEYQKLNRGMTLAGFKQIFWLEFWHRVLGRLLGFAFAVPFAVFLVRRAIDRPLVPRLLLIFALGASQGVLGWLMVASGLVDHPDVSHYRLTAHFGLAVIIYGTILWTAWGLWSPRAQSPMRHPLGGFAHLVLVLLFVQLLSGGLVAGLDAGFAYNTWPLMGESFVPDGLGRLEPWWHNMLDNVTMVQFQHRMGAYLVTLLVALLWWRARAASLGAAAHALAAALLLQMLLGILTVVMIVPVSIGVMHQAGGLVLFTATLWFLHRLGTARA